MLKNRLKHYRHQKEMNQREFAAHLGVNHVMYNRWERQARQPSRESIILLCKKLNCTLDELLYEVPE